MRIITFDIEIATPIEELPGKWEDARLGLAGVSSVVLYDTDTSRFHSYMPTVRVGPKGFEADSYANIEACVEHMNQADLLVSFNGREFDVPVLEAITGMKVAPKHYDLLEQVWVAVGQKHKGYGLGPICERTIGEGKSGKGASAPTMFRQGQFGQLLDYNIGDVHLTRTLFNHIVDSGYILDINNQKLLLRRPSHVHA